MLHNSFFVCLIKQGLIEYNYNEFNDYLVAVNGKEIRYDDLGNLVIYKDIPLVFNQKELYDLTGICGLCYKKDSNTVFYEYAKDGQGNVVALVRDGQIIEEYYYDAWGNTKVEIKAIDPMVNRNPIRWKSHYFDKETEMYFINGRYYDPELCSYIDSMDIEKIIETSDKIRGLNLNAICSDHPTDLEGYNFNIFSNEDLMEDPLAKEPNSEYTIPEPDNRSWWEKHWKHVVRYGLFGLTLMASIILMIIPGTQGFGIGMFTAGLGSAISGCVVSGIIGGLVSLWNGNGFMKGLAESAINGFLDGFTAGALLYCVSSAVSAISKSIKAANQASIKVDGQTIKLQNANKADFTDDAWKEIQSLSKTQNGETISNMASGRKIHEGYKVGMRGNGKEYNLPNIGRMDCIDFNKKIIYELKPNNAKSIAKGVQQLIRYNKGMSNICKLVLVLY